MHACMDDDAKRCSSPRRRLPTRWDAQEEQKIIDTFSTYCQFNSSSSGFDCIYLLRLLFGFAFGGSVFDSEFPAAGCTHRHGARSTSFFGLTPLRAHGAPLDSFFFFSSSSTSLLWHTVPVNCVFIVWQSWNVICGCGMLDFGNNLSNDVSFSWSPTTSRSHLTSMKIIHLSSSSCSSL